MAIDPHYNNVSLLLPMTGVNNSVSFPDFSSVGNSISGYGNAKISTTESKWGGGSAYFDGSGDYLQASSALIPATGNWCIEFWVYLPLLPSSDLYCLFSQYSFSGNGRLTVGVRSSGSINIFLGGTGGFNLDISGSFYLSAQTWNHVVVQRDENVFTIWVNGEQAATATASPSIYTGLPLRIGQQNNGARSLAGYMNDFRLTLVARYSETFTPPSQLFSVELGYKYIKKLTGFLVEYTESLSGTVIVSGNGGADIVAILETTTKMLVTVVTPDATTGAWSALVPPGDYDIAYFADGAQPVCHGPYTVTAP